MRVALTGASGFIGSEICRQLHERGQEVIAMVRSTSRRDHIEPYVARFVEGDQSDRRTWDDFLRGADAVIHNSVDWPAISEGRFSDHLRSNLLASLELLRYSHPRPFVFMSTIAVHHDMSDRWAGRPDEQHPLRPATPYGAYKASVEAHLWAEHYGNPLPDGGERHVAAIRPSGVYGLDPALERSHGYRLIQKLRAGEPVVKPGGGKFVHVEDVAEATISALVTPAASGRPFNLVDCYARWADWAAMAADIMGVEAKIDFSSPERPANTFSKEATQNVLGVSLDRGHAGIRAHLEALIHAMDNGM